MNKLHQILTAVMTVVCLLGAGSALGQAEQYKAEWPDTNFDLLSVELEEIFSGGVPKDGIPAILNPVMVALEQVDLTPNEGVMTLELAGQPARAYPIRYLLWHEIVNDTIGDTSVAVTFCPLCNSGVFFDRRLADEILTFGVSGKLRNSDMVMYDHNTESWWQQATGEGIVGHFAGYELKMLPGWTESWKEFAERNKNKGGLVMSEPRFNRPYGQNPYVGYELSPSPMLYVGDFTLANIQPLARVIRIGNRAWPLERIILEGGTVQELGLEISWTSGQVSALDTQFVGDGMNVGTIRVKDIASGGDVPYDPMFAFAFQAFFPDGELLFEAPNQSESSP